VLAQHNATVAAAVDQVQSSCGNAAAAALAAATACLKSLAPAICCKSAHAFCAVHALGPASAAKACIPSHNTDMQQATRSASQATCMYANTCSIQG
jgi:hypothetical protein